MSNKSNVTSINKSAELARLEAPLQTPAQAFMLEVHSALCKVCAFVFRPFTWIKEQVDGGTNTCRDFNDK